MATYWANFRSRMLFGTRATRNVHFEPCCVMFSAVDMLAMTILCSSATGIVASVCPLVPPCMRTSTRSRWISLRAAWTDPWGVEPTSSRRTSTFRPLMPPAALSSSAA